MLSLPLFFVFFWSGFPEDFFFSLSTLPPSFFSMNFFKAKAHPLFPPTPTPSPPPSPSPLPGASATEYRSSLRQNYGDTPFFSLNLRASMGYLVLPAFFRPSPTFLFSLLPEAFGYLAVSPPPVPSRGVLFFSWFFRFLPSPPHPSLGWESNQLVPPDNLVPPPLPFSSPLYYRRDRGSFRESLGDGLSPPLWSDRMCNITDGLDVLFISLGDPPPPGWSPFASLTPPPSPALVIRSCLKLSSATVAFTSPIPFHFPTALLSPPPWCQSSLFPFIIPRPVSLPFILPSPHFYVQLWPETSIRPVTSPIKCLDRRLLFFPVNALRKTVFRQIR